MEQFPLLNEKLDAGINRPPRFGPIELDLESLQLQLIGTERYEKLEPQEYQILWLLVRANGNMITEREMSDFLYEGLSDDKDMPMTNVAQQRISSIREKLAHLTDGSVGIDTFIGQGYSLVKK